MSFQVPSSSSPSTPDRKMSGSNSFFLGANPSTTPAGPHPFSVEPFTPSDPPPVSPGDSMMNLNSPSKPPTFPQQNSISSEFFRDRNPIRSVLSHELKMPPPTSYETAHNDNDMDEGDDGLEDAERYIESSDSQQPDDDDDEADYTLEEHMGDCDSDSGSNDHAEHQYSNSESLHTIPQGSENDIHELQESNLGQSLSSAASKYEKIAREMYSHMTLQSVDESDELILGTEAITLKLYQESLVENGGKNLLEDALSTVSAELLGLWENYYKQTAVYSSEEYTTTVGPPPQASNFAKANFLASLAFKIHHSPKVSASFTAREMHLPQRLLEWMEDYHNPYPTQYEEIQAHMPSPANHPLFWDTVFNCLIRGKVIIVANMMRDAGWSFLRNISDKPRDNSSYSRYSDITLGNIERVMGIAIQTLLNCPATHGDWNSQNSDWRLFRLRTSQALEDLKSFTEGRNRDRETPVNSIVDSGSYAQAAKKAESPVPWHLYQSLVTLYNLIMGDMNAILANSQDWCEATIGLVAWWDEEQRDRNLSLGAFKKLHRSSAKPSNSVAFDRKLRISFEAATSEFTDFKINTADEVEVALASLFEADIESVIGFLRGWSGPVSCAVAEVASLAGWLPHAEERSLINMGSLDEDEINLLGIQSSPSKSDGVKDRTLITYANKLSERKELRSSIRPHAPIESWELSIAIFGRLDSAERSKEIIWEFLHDFPFQNSETVNKLWELLNNIGLTQHAETAAQSYADGLADQSHKYGEALYYYALAHRDQKVKDVLDLLISYSLVQSSAYPPEEDLDDHLRSLITSPKIALTEIALMDIQAARLLHKSLSGYATLRKFYDIRDSVLLSPAGNGKANTKLRKAEAATALIAVISSSSDNIRGGLYDSECGAVVNVDFLLALLGEATVLVNQADFNLKEPQIDVLLRAIEDLQTVSPRVYNACAEFLKTVLASCPTLKGSMLTDISLKLTTNTLGSSDLCNSGSLMSSSRLKQSMSSSTAVVKVGVKRGWDWREEILARVTQGDVLKILRLGLAKDLARAWLMEVDNQL